MVIGGGVVVCAGAVDALKHIIIKAEAHVVLAKYRMLACGTPTV